MVEVAAATHIGGRKTNADAILLDHAADLRGVADGKGDGPSSACVAQAGLSAIRALFPQPWVLLPPPERCPQEARDRLLMGMACAHGRLLVPWRRPTRERIGTTFAGVVVCGELLAVGHIGDSRIYLLRARDGRLVQLTEDDTVAGEALRRGVPAESVGRLPDAAKLTQLLGVTRAFNPEPFVRRWEPGDTVLLCTDGVSDYLDADVLANVVLDVGDLGVAAQRLVAQAIEIGGQDNATVVLVHRTT